MVANCCGWFRNRWGRRCRRCYLGPIAVAIGITSDFLGLLRNDDRLRLDA